MKDIEKKDVFTIRVSLVTKMVINVTMLICLAIAVTTYLSVKGKSRVITDGLIRIAKQQTRHIAYGTKSAFWSLNWIFIENLLRETRENSPCEVVFAKVVKPNGEVYLADDRAHYGQTVETSLLFKKETMVENYFMTEKQEKGILMVHPIKIGDQTWYVFMGLSLRSVKTAVKAVLIRNIAWGGLILMIAAFFSFLLSKSISSPLIRLAHSATVVAAGDLEHNVSVKSKDEVGLLSHAFNRMLKNLKDAYEELAASEKRYRALVATASKAKVGIAVIQNDGGRKGVFKYANRHVADLTGYSSRELTGMTVKDIIHPESLDSALEWYEMKTSHNNQQETYQFRIANKQGEEIPIEINSGTTDFDGRKALVCYVKDITTKLEAEKRLKGYSENLEKMVKDRTEELRQVIANLKSTQSHLVQSEKLASVGQLAAGIAHEINTPIQYIGDNTRFLQDAFDDLSTLFDKYEQLPKALTAGISAEKIMEEVKSAIKEMDINYLRTEVPLAIKQTMEGVERVSVIVRSMKEFAHPGVSKKTAMDINRAIDNTVTVSRNEWKYVAEIETDLDASLSMIPCLPGELNQVFLNIIINAAQAIGDAAGNGSGAKGAIRISTRKNGDYAEIRIGDTGMGIPAEIQNRIFDPFFTTKDVGKGTGQGLAISRSVIVEKHGGDLSFETEAGKGTTFIIRLPLEEPAEERKGA